MTDRHNLNGPCDQCPFRSQGRRALRGLRPGRVTELMEEADPFYCHKTIHKDTPPSVCGGWLAMQWRVYNGFPKLTAMAARIGMFDPHTLRVGEVFESTEDAEEAQRCFGG